MFDIRPVGYVIGLLVCVLGLTMLVPMAVDLTAGDPHWKPMLEAAVVTALAGVFLALACRNSVGAGLSLRQTFLLTTGVWLALPVFGALPFLIGATEARFVDAFFEAMSGLTTTGSTVFSGLDDLPRGLLLWRAILQWYGGIGIIVVAMVFLPELRVGGMQIFRTEGFDTMGKILPRATEIASRVAVVYVGLTIACTTAYFALGMDGFDAICHAMTTIATGGFANSDQSFGAYPPATAYAAILFMALAALPFVRYVQLISGGSLAILRDSQVRAFIATLALIGAVMLLYQVAADDRPFEPALRAAFFNVTSLLTGTGYASEDYMAWGAFAATALYFVGFIGGCAGSTACSIKIFRYQLLFASVRAQVQRIHSPSGMFAPRYEGRPVGEDVVNSVMAFFVLFIVSLGVLSVLLAMTGLDFVTATSGAAATLANIGPGLGPEIGPAGNFGGLNDAAKWLMSAAMLIGRLELLAVYVLFTAAFWRA